MSVENIKRFVEILARDFKIPPPNLEVLKPEVMMWRVGYADAPAFYHAERETIIIREDSVELGNLLHEFVHHLQYIRSGRDADKAFPAEEVASKPHCQRSFEIEAKIIASDYEDFYRELWEVMVRGRRGS
jgi:hypothetical protein